MNSSESKSQVTKVLPMENYYACGEGVGDGWSRNAHLPPVSPSGSCSHLQIHQLTHIFALMFSTVCWVKALDSGFPFTLLNFEHHLPQHPAHNCTESHPAWHFLSTLGECTWGTERRKGDGEPVFLKEIWKRICKVQKEREDWATTRFKPGPCLQKLPWLALPICILRMNHASLTDKENEV